LSEKQAIEMTRILDPKIAAALADYKRKNSDMKQSPE
jgi:hypothetical protein